MSLERNRKLLGTLELLHAKVLNQNFDCRAEVVVVSKVSCFIKSDIDSEYKKGDGSPKGPFKSQLGR